MHGVEGRAALAKAAKQGDFLGGDAMPGFAQFPTQGFAQFGC
jgi:hypothetical protein